MSNLDVIVTETILNQLDCDKETINFIARNGLMEKKLEKFKEIVYPITGVRFLKNLVKVCLDDEGNLREYKTKNSHTVISRVNGVLNTVTSTYKIEDVLVVDMTLYDQQGRIVYEFCDSTVTRYSYDGDIKTTHYNIEGWMKEESDKDGNIIKRWWSNPSDGIETMEYDQKGNITKHLKEYLNWSKWSKWSYTKEGKPLTYEASGGFKKTWIYQENMVMEVIDGSKFYEKYDPKGNMITEGKIGGVSADRPTTFWENGQLKSYGDMRIPLM